MQILEIVKMNDGYAFVVDEAAPLVYHEEDVYDDTFKRTEHMLVGESADGLMDFLMYHRYGGNMRAFAGRPLTLQMDDGNTRVVKDNWWSEGSIAWSAVHMVELRGFAYAPMCDIVEHCVFYGGIIREDRLQELINEFHETHPDYTPWDYSAWDSHCRVLRKANIRKEKK